MSPTSSWGSAAGLASGCRRRTGAGLLPQLRRQATGPDATEQAGEGLAFGGPQRVIHALKRWEAVGVDRVNFLMNAMEVIPQADVLASLRLFAKEVMPAFADDKPAPVASA